MAVMLVSVFIFEGLIASLFGNLRDPVNFWNFLLNDITK